MIHTLADLRSMGYSRRQVVALVESGRLLRAGHHYAAPTVDESVLRPLRWGMRATCLTAARHHGLWVPPGSRQHVYGRRTRDAPNGWVAHGWTRNWSEPDLVASPALLLAHAAGCLDPLEVGVLADSALHSGKLHPADIAAIRRGTSRAVGRVLDRSSGLAESGTESKVRLFFQLRRVPVRAQVQIGGVGRVDLLVGRRWIIECDSRAHHTGEIRYAYDRERDAAGVESGYFTTRLTYEMVFGSWDRTTARLDRVLQSRQHLVSPERWISARRAR